MVNPLIYGITQIIKTNFRPVTLEEKKTTLPIADLLRVGDLVPSCCQRLSCLQSDIVLYDKPVSEGR